MIPILHEECIGLVNMNYLNGTKEIIIRSLTRSTLKGGLKTQWAGDYNVGIVEFGEQLYGPTGELDSNAEQIITIAIKELCKVGWLVLRECLLGDTRTKLGFKPGLIFQCMLGRQL